MPFVADDVVIALVVIPIAAKLGDRLLEYGADVIESGFKASLRLFKNRIEAASSAEEKKAAEAEFARYVKAHPQVVEQLAVVVTRQVAPGNPDPVTRIEAIYEYLDFILRMVAYLGRPFAADGFFTGADTPVVVDVRPVGGDTFTEPEKLWGGVWVNEPQIGMNTEGALNKGIPRIWLTHPHEQVSLDASLPPEAFMRSMVGNRRVREITPSAVVVITELGLTALERYGRDDQQRARDKLMEKPERIDMPSSPDGVIALRETLLNAVGEAAEKRQRDSDEWGTALAPA